MSGSQYADKNTDKNPDKYADMMHLPHHVSAVHPQMSLQDRAARFSPFAALTGHDEAIEETARLTSERPEIDESSKEMLDDRLRRIGESVAEFTYFVPDEKKSGGAYRTTTGVVKKIRELEQEIILADGTTIPFENLIAID